MLRLALRLRPTGWIYISTCRGRPDRFPRTHEHTRTSRYAATSGGLAGREAPNAWLWGHQARRPVGMPREPTCSMTYSLPAMPQRLMAPQGGLSPGLDALACRTPTREAPRGHLAAQRARLRARPHCAMHPCWRTPTGQKQLGPNSWQSLERVHMPWARAPSSFGYTRSVSLWPPQVRPKLNLV